MKRLAMLLAFLASAAAADDRAHPYGDRPLDFALTFSTHSFDLDYGGPKVDVDTSVDRVTASLRERYNDHLQLGFLGGPAYLTQTNNSATSGRELNGYHVGLTLDIDLLRREPLDVFFGAVWIYQKLDHADGSQRVVIATHEPSARLGAGFRIADSVRVYGGGSYGSIRGEQRQSGTINETTTVRESNQAGAFAGLELLLKQDGYVGLYAESGIDRSVAVYFGRHF